MCVPSCVLISVPSDVLMCVPSCVVMCWLSDVFMCGPSDVFIFVASGVLVADGLLPVLVVPVVLIGPRLILVVVTSQELLDWDSFVFNSMLISSRCLM